MDNINYLKIIDKGTYGTVYQTSKKNIVVKVIKKSNYNKKEYLYAKKQGILGTGPKVYKKVKKDNNVFIYMQKVDIILKDWLLKKHSKKTYEETYKKLLRLVDKLHNNNIIHGDIHIGNIGKIKNKWVLIDYGLSHKTKDNQFSIINIFNYIINKPLYSNKGYEDYFKIVLVPFSKLSTKVKIHIKLMNFLKSIKSF